MLYEGVYVHTNLDKWVAGVHGGTQQGGGEETGAAYIISQNIYY